MNQITIKIANSFSGYFEVLYRMNRNLLKLCGKNYQYPDFSDENILLDLITDIPRIVPYKYNKDCKNNKDCKKIELYNKNGLLEFEENLDYLKTDYQDLFDNNYDFLDRIRKIRNKCEHRMHSVSQKSVVFSPNCTYNYIFQINSNNGNEVISINTQELITFIKGLNELFTKLQKEVITFAEENNLTEYNYFKKITKFEFKEINQIYDSCILHIVGSIMRDYND